MIDFGVQPDTPVWLSYENLSKEGVTAEFQKDLLAQMLQELFPQAEGFLESPRSEDVKHIERESNTLKSGRALAPKPLHWHLACETCNWASDTTLFISGSARARDFGGSGNDKESLVVEFKVKSPDSAPRIWKVRIGLRPARFFIAAAQSLPVGNPAGESFFVAKPCPTSGLCSFDMSFEDLQSATQAMTSWHGLMATRSLVAGAALRSSDFSLPLLVRSRDDVKVIFRPSRGLRIETRGRALANGVRGQNVRIELPNQALNRGSGYADGMHAQGRLGPRVIEATVKAAGEVEYVR